MKHVRALALLLASLIALAACGGSPKPTTLYIYSWSDYTDPTVIAQFEQENAVKIVLNTFNSNEDMIAKVRGGSSGYDIVVPSDYAVALMVRDGLLAPLDQQQVPQLANILPANRHLYFDPDNRYSVPYLYGITGIAYNKRAFPTPPTSWAALFDPAQAARYAGKFSMLDDARESPGAVLRYLGKSVNTTDAATMAQVQRILTAQRPLVAAYDSNDVQRKLVSGDYVIAHAYNGMALQAVLGLSDQFQGNPDIGFVLPREGGIIWQDNLAILKDSPSIALATKFLDFTMRPDIAARNAAYVNYLTPNAAAVKQLPPAVQALYAQGFAPDAAMYQRLEWARVPPESSGFAALWAAIKGP